MQAAYTAEAVAAILKKPQNRREVMKKVLEKNGGSLEGFWYAFGDYDVVLICQMPDNITAAALSMAVSAGGALKAGKTTPLLTAEEGTDAMKKAAKSGIQASHQIASFSFGRLRIGVILLPVVAEWRLFGITLSQDYVL